MISHTRINELVVQVTKLAQFTDLLFSAHASYNDEEIAAYTIIVRLHLKRVRALAESIDDDDDS